MSMVAVLSQAFGENACHPSLRSGSPRWASQILRFAQDDRQDLSQVRSRESSLQMSSIIFAVLLLTEIGHTYLLTL